jgi:hypothetical protein
MRIGMTNHYYRVEAWKHHQLHYHYPWLVSAQASSNKQGGLPRTIRVYLFRPFLAYFPSTKQTGNTSPRVSRCFVVHDGTASVSRWIDSLPLLEAFLLEKNAHHAGSRIAPPLRLSIRAIGWPVRTQKMVFEL